MGHFDDTLIFGTQINGDGFEQGLTKLDVYAANLASDITGKFASAVGSAFAAIPEQIIGIGSTFESSMSQVAATMGITAAAEEFEILSDAAKDLGERTQFSAAQASSALNFLALAGYDAETSISALPTVLNLAAAGGMELAAASDMVTDSMSALGLETSQMEMFTDELAKTSQKSNTSVSQLGEAILTVGGTAKMLSGGLTEMNTMLGVIADNGVKGAEGGTALRNVILSLSAPTDKAAEALDRLGVSAFDGAGSFRALPEIFSDFNAALEPLSEEEKTQALNDIFNKVDLKTVNALLGTSAERFEDLAGMIEDSTGAAADMAETMNDNLAGDITICQSALEGLANTAYESFAGTMREAVQSVTADIGTLTASMKDGELSKSMDILSEGFSRIASSAASLVADDIIPAVINGLALIIEHGNEIISVVAGITAANIALKAVDAFGSMSKSIQAAIRMFALLEAETTAETFQQAALNAELSFGEIAVGLFTGKITLATAAQAAWNIVTAAFPGIAVAAAVGVLAASIVHIVSEINDMNASLKESEDVIDGTKRSFDDLNSTINENNSATEKNKETLKSKIGIYEELIAKESRTEEEEERLKDLTKEIQELSPVTLKFIDEETNSYLSLADSIDTVIAALDRKRNYENAESQWNTAKDNLDTLYDQYEKLREEEGSLYDEMETANIRQKGIIHGKLAANKEAQNEILAAIVENEKLVGDAEKKIKEYYTDDSSAGNAEPITVKQNTTAELARGQGEKYAEYEKQNAEDRAKAHEEATNNLKSEYDRIDHEFAMGRITSEEEVYAQKKAAFEKYGNENYSDHWKYAEELASMENGFSEKQKAAAEKSANDRIKADKEVAAQRIAAMEEAWNEISREEELGNITLEEAAERRKDFIDTYHPDPKEYHSYYVKIQDDEKKLTAAEEDALRQRAKNIDRQLQYGLISEEEAYEQRKELLETYCEEGTDLYYEFYDDVYSYEQKMLQRQLDDRKALLNEEVSAVQDSVSKIVDKYKSAYSDIQSNIKSYSNKLKAVAGDTFSVEETENADGSKTRTINISNIRKQIETMKKYNEAMLKLRDGGAPASMLEELLSMDYEDGLQAANYLLNSGHLEDYSKLYAERDRVADELAQSFYKPDIDRLNNDTVSEIKSAYEALPDEFYDLGQSAIESFIQGMKDGTGDLSEIFGTGIKGITDSAKNYTDNLTAEDIQTDTAYAGNSATSTVTMILPPPLQRMMSFAMSNQQLMSANSAATSAGAVGTAAGFDMSAFEKLFKNTALKVVSQNRITVDGKTLAEVTNEENTTIGRAADAW